MKSISPKLTAALSWSTSSRLTVLLLLAVIVPSVCLLWFMNEAVENEQLAMRQKLMDAYRGHLDLHQKLLEVYLRSVADGLTAQSEEVSSSALFADQVRSGFADAVIVYNTNGSVVYPDGVSLPRSEPFDQAWSVARSLEPDNPAVAATEYAKIAKQSTDISRGALALQAQARCLVRTGRRDAAADVLTGQLAEQRYERAVDNDGRWIVPSAELMAYELLRESAPERAGKISEMLKVQLNNYEIPLPSAQRRFLMRELSRLRSDDGMFPTLPAEELAARYLEAGGASLRDPVVRATPLANIWQFASSHGRVITLHKTESLLERMRRSLPQIAEPNVRVEFVPPGQETRESLLSEPAGPSLQGWRISLALRDQRLYEAGAHRRARVYLWVGLLVVALVLTLAVLAVGMIRRQAALTQLRNDLVANVTHELKTPLASTRLLVDTLLNSDRLDERTAREYLQLIARENLRLSRLIDNFLTFSRIQRNKYTFDFKEVPAAGIAEAAVAAMRERLNTPGCHFHAHIPPGLPRVRADADAMVTALVNLLDNAYKYTGETKEIALDASAENGSVKFSVQDNGIGLTPRDAERVFKRFFQVDQHLSRTSGGAGLGLSIVQFVVSAHGGKVQVQSAPERGSTFTVTLPANGSRQGEETKT